MKVVNCRCENLAKGLVTRSFMIDANFNSLSVENIYIFDNLGDWEATDGICPNENDVVLTFDFGLFYKLSSQSKRVFYLDRLVDQSLNNDLNESIKLLLREWYLDKNGNDIFVHSEVQFGDSLTTLVLNDIFYFVRLRTCLNTIVKSDFKRIVICSRERIIHDFFKNHRVEVVPVTHFDAKPLYFYFPISDWLLSKHGRGSFLKRLAIALFNIRHKFVYYLDRLWAGCQKKRVFIHEYHPTKGLIDALQRDSSKNVVLGLTSIERSLTTAIFRDHVIPYWGNQKDFKAETNYLLSKFLNQNKVELFIGEGEDIGSEIAEAISKSISHYLPFMLRDLISIKRYVLNLPVDLVISISSLGLKESLIRIIAKKYGAVDFIVINGILCSRFSDEGKGFDYTNSYSESIKNLYFGNQDNVFALGDPRMDAYNVNEVALKQNYDDGFIIGVGTSGFNHLDLNSNVAIEFDFLFSVLTAISRTNVFTRNTEVKILVRRNGILDQYLCFVDLYFPSLNISFSQGEKVVNFLNNVDLYITFYSQTLFEASCLKIPCIYFVNHREEIQEPFGLGTPFYSASNIDGLVSQIERIYSANSEETLIPDIADLEHYVGPLDGKNTQRNLLFINSLLLK